MEFFHGEMLTGAVVCTNDVILSIISFSHTVTDLFLDSTKFHTGDDPITPSQLYSNVEEFFHDVRPPLFDQFRVAVVADDDGDCFDGYVKRGSGFMQQPSALLLWFGALALVYGMM